MGHEFRDFRDFFRDHRRRGDCNQMSRLRNPAADGRDGVFCRHDTTDNGESSTSASEKARDLASPASPRTTPHRA